MRILDIILSAIAVAILAFLLPLLAFIIKLDSRGNVFYSQARLGRMGSTFKVLKFRTMRSDAEGVFNADGSRYVGSRDPRITRVGHVLRLGLDELPQTLNILRGEMSFIGPRPDDVFATQHYQGLEWLKLSITPGITGLAQVTGRNQLPWHERMKYDIYYAYNRNLGMDLAIIWRTLAMLAKIEVTKPVVTLAKVEEFLLSPILTDHAERVRRQIQSAPA